MNSTQDSGGVNTCAGQHRDLEWAWGCIGVACLGGLGVSACSSLMLYVCSEMLSVVSCVLQF